MSPDKISHTVIVTSDLSFQDMLESEHDLSQEFDPFTVYLMHVFIQGQVITGFSTSGDQARSYVFRAIGDSSVKVVGDKEGDIAVRSKMFGENEIFWCVVISHSYFAILSEKIVPLDTENTYEIAYWGNVKKATIDIASSVEDAIEMANDHLNMSKLQLFEDQNDRFMKVMSGNRIVATLISRPTDDYRRISRLSRLG